MSSEEKGVSQVNEVNVHRPIPNPADDQNTVAGLILHSPIVLNKPTLFRFTGTACKNLPSNVLARMFMVSDRRISCTANIPSTHKSSGTHTMFTPRIN